MNDLQEQLAALRERVARVHSRYSEKYAGRAAPAPVTQVDLQNTDVIEAPEPHEHGLSGQVIETAHGCHFESERLYQGHRRHGSADIGALSDLPHDLLHTISDGEAPSVPPGEWAFLDTETTGLAGGSGTCAFLIGVGRITPQGFHVRQFFMRDFAEETSQLTALSEYLDQFRVLITYNGRTFDQPLLETRYRLNRTQPPFSKLAHHLDLLYGARRLWKLRYESCRLVDLETQVLGFEREGDVPGSLIPYLYFEYVRTRHGARMQGVFEHNCLDILTLACLTGIVPYAFRDPGDCGPGLLKHGSEIVGIARWVQQAGEFEQARTLLAKAMEAGLPDDLMFRTLWDIAALDRKLGAETQSLAAWEDLGASRNPFRVRALEELAKHHEHRAKNPGLALEYTRTALEFEDTPELRHREQRLQRRVSTAAKPTLRNQP
ncbi:MAG: ribonuclease H-like domain-containing protein [Acidobacteriota bacterium]